MTRDFTRNIYVTKTETQNGFWYSLSVYIVQVFLACKQEDIREEYTLSKALRKRFSGIDIVSTDFIFCNIG